MRTPTFWKTTNLLSTALLPVAALYSALSQARINKVNPVKVPATIICIGNLVAGGAGKTPVALALGTLLKHKGKNVHYLSRGYKGNYKGTQQVDINAHTVREVGDEPLLLARLCPTWVSRNRVEGAKKAILHGAEIIIMDDGFQNPYLYKDISLLVVDGHYGLGNSRMIPAGPLREPIESAVKRTSALIVIGDDKHSIMQHFAVSIPIIKAGLYPENPRLLEGKQVVAFCGIAHPDKFYRTLQQTGCLLKATISYPDHYVFAAKDTSYLLAEAEKNNAILVTTEKDYVRVPFIMQDKVMPLPVNIHFDDSDALLKVIMQ